MQDFTALALNQFRFSLFLGEPFSTSMDELRPQLKFLGIEYVDEMFKVFQTTAFAHSGDPKAIPKIQKVQIGNFLFFMRNIMLRHSAAQTYRGTSTTIMSLPSKV